ncbi:hypothetical protein GIB67_009650, partial [Kingdonia uniflora]
DDTLSILSNARQLLPNIDSSHIKSGNVSIAHLRTYLTVATDREDDIFIARVFIRFMMGHLWFQTANNTVPLRYLAAVVDLDSATQYDWGFAILASLYHSLDTAVTTGGAITGFVQLLTYSFYEYCEVGHSIVKEEVKFLAYPRLKAWEMGNKRKTNDQTTNLFILGRYHIDHRTVETITWEPWLDSAVSKIDDVLTAKLLSRKRMPLQVPNGNCKYYLRDARGSWKARFPEDAEYRSVRTDYTQSWYYTRGGYANVESARVAQRFKELEDELAIAHKKIDSINHQLYAHDLQLRRGRDVRVMLLPSGCGARTRQRGSGPRTRGSGISRRGRGTKFYSNKIVTEVE